MFVLWSTLLRACWFPGQPQTLTPLPPLVPLSAPFLRPSSLLRPGGICLQTSVLSLPLCLTFVNGSSASCPHSLFTGFLPRPPDFAWSLEPAFHPLPVCFYSRPAGSAELGSITPLLLPAACPLEPWLSSATAATAEHSARQALGSDLDTGDPSMMRAVTLGLSQA